MKSNGHCLIYCFGLFLYKAAPDASDDQFESLSAFSETDLTCKMTSAESDLTLTPSTQNGKVIQSKVDFLRCLSVVLMLASFCKFWTFLPPPPGVKSTNHVRDEPTVQIYFPSDIRAAGIKDVVRNFIREAKMVCCLFLFIFSSWFSSKCTHGVVVIYHITEHAMSPSSTCAGFGHSDGMLQWCGAAVWHPGGLQEEERVCSPAAWPLQPPPVRRHVAGARTWWQKLPCEFAEPLSFTRFSAKHVQTEVDWQDEEHERGDPGLLYMPGAEQTRDDLKACKTACCRTACDWQSKTTLWWCYGIHFDYFFSVTGFYIIHWMFLQQWAVLSQ